MLFLYIEDVNNLNMKKGYWNGQIFEIKNVHQRYWRPRRVAATTIRRRNRDTSL